MDNSNTAGSQEGGCAFQERGLEKRQHGPELDPENMKGFRLATP